MCISLVGFFFVGGGIVGIERLMWHMEYLVFLVEDVILRVLEVLEVVWAFLMTIVLKVLQKTLVLEEDPVLLFLGEVIRK